MSTSLSSEPKFRHLFEAVPGMLVAVLPDAPRFTIVAASDAYLRAMMAARDEILGRPLFEVLPENPAHPEATGTLHLSQSLARVLATHATDTIAVERFDIRSPSDGGFIERWWSSVGSPVLEDEGLLEYIVCRIEDVTEFMLLKQTGTRDEVIAAALGTRAETAQAEVFLRAQDLQAANQRLRVAQEEIGQLERLKTRFFADMSHELRTPLELIIGPIEQLLDSPRIDGAERRELEVVRRNARTLVRDVDDLLEIARLEVGELKPEYAEVDVAELLGVVAAQFESLARSKGIYFGAKIPEHLNAEVDAEKLQHVILNLLSNAYRFTPAGGCVGVRLAESEHGRFVLEVADSGSGIPHDQREAVFERFRQFDRGTPRHMGASGLGLAIAREFVTLHGGSIRITGEPEAGAVFLVDLPRWAPPQAEVRPASGARRALGSLMVEQVFSDLRTRPHSPAPTARSSVGDLILVVEDNPDLSQFIAAGLEPDHRVVTACDGQEGLEKAIDLRPDVILADILMPVMSGEEMVLKIRQRPELWLSYIVVLTVKSDEEVRVRLLREGAQDYIIKPFSMPELRARVDNLVARKRAEEALREAQRLRDEWISVVAHDLRQPVSVIALSAQTLPRLVVTGPAEKTSHAVERIARSASTLERMVNDLLDVSRIDARRLALQRSEVDLVPLLMDVIERMPEIARSRARLAIHDSRQRVLVHADAGRVEQVLGNLLSNAVKYGTAGTEIEVALAVRDGQAQISVSNQGRGIAADDLPRIFERFHRTREAQGTTQGIGLGLYIARGLVEAHGGRIWADSTPGGTTTFHFTLPVAQPAAAPAVKPPEG